MAKKRSAKEHRPVQELERAMDVELFLELQNNWPEDSPHHLMVLHEMFWHAANEGQKEAEETICQGHWPHTPQPNPEAGIPAVQLVGPQMMKEELMEIYLEVYKLHRLPGSPPSKLAIWEEIMAKVPDNSCSMKPQHSLGQKATTPPGVEPPWRGDDPVERTLATVQEAHQKVLSTASTLEKEIERLHGA